MKPPFPSVWDNTMRTAFRTCFRRGYWEFLRNQVPDRPSVDLHTGAVFAKALEVTRKAFYGDGKSSEVALAEGARALIQEWGDFDAGDDVKNLESTMSAFNHYFTRWPLETDYLKPEKDPSGRPLVEFSFSLPIPEVIHPETDEPLIYAGRFDMIARHQQMQNVLVGVDEKTTKQLGASWLKRWTLRSQFIGYKWGARPFGFNLQAFVIRGISFLKKGHGDLETIVMHGDHLVDAWYKQLVRDLMQIKAAWREGYYDYDFGEACSMYGGCTYMRLCESPDPEQWLSTFFVERVWDPLKREARD